MDKVTQALARLQITPGVDELARQFAAIKIDDRLQWPIYGKRNVARNLFWKHRRSKKCLKARQGLEQTIKSGEDAMRRLIASEVIAPSRK